MMRLFLSTIVMVGIASLNPGGDGATLHAQVSTQRLGNGLLLLVTSDPAATQISVTAGYFVGYRDGRLRGLAHLMEHLAMRETRDGAGLAARYGPLGITGGAFTTGNVTVFSMSGPGGVAMLDTLLALQRARMSDLALSDAALASERRSVHTEVDGRGVSPWLTGLFGAHRLGISDAHDDLDRITHDDLLTFYRRYYMPSNAALVIRSPFPDSLVLAGVTKWFGSLPRGDPLRRPVDRDSTPVGAVRWSGQDASGSRVLAFAVPGMQHPWHGLLASAVAAARSELAARRSPVDLRLSDDAPVGVLTIIGRGQETELAATLASLRGALRGPVAPAAPVDEASAFLTCEAAGDWRYCLADADTPADAPAGLLALLDPDTQPPSSPLWPTPRRTPPQVLLAEATPRPVVPKWVPPVREPVRWNTTASGMEWLAREGGVPDSVHVLVLLAPRDPNPEPRTVAALELLARAWPELRLPSGARVDSQFRARGIQVTVRSLPYPTLATTDRFLVLGTPPSPLGLYGLEFRITASTSAAPAGLAMVREVLATATLDTPSFVALHTQQTQLLKDDAGAARSIASGVHRRQVATWVGLAQARVAPLPPAERQGVMGGVTDADVVGVARGLWEHGAARVAILGADQTLAGEWIARSGLERSTAPRWDTVGLACGAADTVTRIARPPATANTPAPPVTLWAYRCLTPTHSDAVMAVANAAIGGFENAILAKRLRADLGLAYSFSSRVLRFWQAPAAVWVLEISTPAEGADRATAEIRGTLRNAAARLTEAQFENARRTASAAARRRTQDPFSWLTGVLWNGRSPEEDLAGYGAVTLQEVREALARYWDGEDIAITRSG